MPPLYTWASEAFDALIRSSLKRFLNIEGLAVFPCDAGMCQFMLSSSFMSFQLKFVTSSILSMRDHKTHWASPFDKKQCATSKKMWSVGKKKSRNATLERTPSAE